MVASLRVLTAAVPAAVEEMLSSALAGGDRIDGSPWPAEPVSGGSPALVVVGEGALDALERGSLAVPSPSVLVAIADGAEAIARVMRLTRVDECWSSAPPRDRVVAAVARARSLENEVRSVAVDEVLRRQATIASELRSTIAREAASRPSAATAPSIQAGSGPLRVSNARAFESLVRHAERRARGEGGAVVVVHLSAPSSIGVQLRSFDAVEVDARGDALAILLLDPPDELVEAVRATHPDAALAMFPSADTNAASWLAAQTPVRPPRGP
jgi:hypothetical protein